MAGKFIIKKFSDINFNDSFFDSLKDDYPGTENSTSFIDWFNKKANNGDAALVFEDGDGIGSFICLKDENEEIKLKDSLLPKAVRYKISTIKIADRYRGKRIGEGAIGLVLWKWQEKGYKEIYVTVFDKHELLINQLLKFGFNKAGYNLNGEGVYIRSKNEIDYSDPYKSFPFINSDFGSSGYLIVDDSYHDTLFPYSELKSVSQTDLILDISNGLSKIYVGKQYSKPPYEPGDPIFIYRRYTGDSGKKYKSCLTSFCVLTKIIYAKQNWQYLISFQKLLNDIGNKSIFDQSELQYKYDNYKNVIVYEMVYYGYFGPGNNINMDWLDKNGFWSTAHNGKYPSLIKLSKVDFINILKKGNISIKDVIINNI